MKVGIDQLRALWEKQGVWGSWRQILKSGYKPGEPYFEFGIMPESNQNVGGYNIVLDHEVHVRLVPHESNLVGAYLIRPNSVKAGTVELDQSLCCRNLFVSDAQFDVMLKDAAQIYEEYKDDDIICFWSIPNKWFDDLSLIKFITKNIVLTEDYKNQIRGHQDWYWP